MVPLPWVPVRRRAVHRPDRASAAACCWPTRGGADALAGHGGAAVLAPVYIGLPLGALVAIRSARGPRSAC